MRVSPDARACLTGDNGVLMHVRRDRIYSLDRVGTEMWRLFAGGQTTNEIARSISCAYGAPLSRVERDVRQFFDRLEQNGLVVREDGEAHQMTDAPAAPDVARGAAVTPSRLGLVGRSVWQLLQVDLALRLRGFGYVYESVARHRTRPVASAGEIVTAVCGAVNRACTIYPRQALCLQRSVATTRLLRDCGVGATLVIGARKHPFCAHAWVEVDGDVVNDKRGVKHYYQELDRF